MPDQESHTLHRAEIEQRVPHGGRMCLLDRVVQWDADQIVCEADGHRDPQHPLRTPAGLPALCGIEYAAQAMAVHGALLAEAAGKPAVGYLASLREVVLGIDRLDTVQGCLRVRAERLLAVADNLMYAFSVSAGNVELLYGRAAVVQPQTGSRT